MTGQTPPRFDFDAMYRGESPADGVPAVTTPPWDTLTVDAAAVAGNTSLAKLQSAQPKFVRRTYQALES
jgi:hypothetical protein